MMSLLKSPLRKVVPTTCVALALALIATGSLTAPVSAQIGENVRNGDFSAGTDQWFTTGNLTPTIVDGRLCVDVPGGTVNPWDAIVGQNDIALVQGVSYTYSYELSSNVDEKNARALVGLAVDPFDAYFTANELLTTTTSSSSNTFEQATSTDLGQVAFQIGGSPDPWTFCVDNVALVGGGENVRNGDFSAGTDQWFTTGNLTPTIVDGRLCVDVPGGTVNPWDAIVGQNDIALVQGVSYTLLLRALVECRREERASARRFGGRPVRRLLHRQRAAHDDHFFVEQHVRAGDVDRSRAGCVPDRRLARRLDVLRRQRLTRGWRSARAVRARHRAPRPRQPGRLPPRWTEGRDARHRRDRAVGVGAEERVRPSRQVGCHIAGRDRYHVRAQCPRDRLQPLQASRGGLHTHRRRRDEPPVRHLVDGVRATADRCAVAVLPAAQRHADPRRDRGCRVRAALAGHVGVAPNTGDDAVPCQTPEFSQTVYGEPWTCDYTLDVNGGWYDAGDHGKYVVNGGISVAQLMSTWERNQNARHTDRALGDRTLPVPERGNRVPDVLDEARWELEWMLTMQVPAGKPLAGMVHHKVHDHEWTGLPLDPAADDKIRELHRPSTAATLNLAAVAAQGSRLFERYDRSFARELLEGRPAGVDGGERQSCALRAGRRRELRRWPVRRLGRLRRVLLGGR